MILEDDINKVTFAQLTRLKLMMFQKKGCGWRHHLNGPAWIYSDGKVFYRIAEKSLSKKQWEVRRVVYIKHDKERCDATAKRKGMA